MSTPRPIDLSALASRLEAARGSQRWRDLAKAAGVGVRTLEELRHPALCDERGRGKRGPTLDTLCRVAAAVGVSPGWLAFGEGDHASP